MVMMKGYAVSQDPRKSEDHILEGEMRDPYTDDIHDPPAEGNFSVESGNTIKPVVIEVLAHMGYVDRWPPSMV
jgi:hypothetical protein